MDNEKKIVDAEVTKNIPEDILATQDKKDEVKKELGEKVEAAKEAVKAEVSKESSAEAVEGTVETSAEGSVEGSLNLGNKALVGFLRNSVISAPGIVFADKDTLAPLKNIKKEILPPKGYKVEVEDNKAKIDLFVYALFGTEIPKAFAYIKKELEISLINMLGVDISEINMTVLDLLSQEDYDLVVKG